MSKVFFFHQKIKFEIRGSVSRIRGVIDKTCSKDVRLLCSQFYQHNSLADFIWPTDRVITRVKSSSFKFLGIM